MPLYMDIHKNVEGITTEGLQEAHEQDLKVQARHGVTFHKYWYSEKEGTIVCLCEAPSKEAAIAVHQEAHGNLPDEVIEVVEGA